MAIALSDAYYPGRGVSFDGSSAQPGGTSADLYLTVTGRASTSGIAAVQDWPTDEDWAGNVGRGPGRRASNMSVRVSFPFVVGSKNPFDRMRVALTKGLAVAAHKELVNRGDEVDATVTVTSRRNLGVLEVGLVCTETYEVADADDRGVSWGTAYECWTPLELGARIQTVRLRVPADGPYSYTGTVLSFRWEVVVRGARKRRVDARATFDIEVHP